MELCHNEKCTGINQNEDTSDLCHPCELRYNTTDENLENKLEFLMNQRVTNNKLLSMCLNERKRRKKKPFPVCKEVPLW